MTTQAVTGRRYFTKAWLMEQKSLIALLVLIAIVSTLSPNFFTINNGDQRQSGLSFFYS